MEVRHVDFVSKCSDELNKNEFGAMYMYGGKNYFSLESIKSLSKIVDSIGTFTEIVITPYYFFGEQILELYDYTLSIRIVDTLQSRQQFYLEETGKKSIEEIDVSVIEKLDNTYYEVLEGDIQTFLNSLDQYAIFMDKRERDILFSVRNEVSINNEQEHGIFYEVS